MTITDVVVTVLVYISGSSSGYCISIVVMLTVCCPRERHDPSESLSR